MPLIHNSLFPISSVLYTSRTAALRLVLLLVLVLHVHVLVAVVVDVLVLVSVIFELLILTPFNTFCCKFYK